MTNFSSKLFLVLIFLSSLVVIPATVFCEDVAEGDDKLSVETVRETIDRVYLEVLQRYPDEGGLYTYTHFLTEDGKSEAWLKDVLVNSEEGQQVSERKQKQEYLLYAVGAFPLLALGLLFFFRKNTKDFIFKTLLIFFGLCASFLFLEFALRGAAAYKDYKNIQSWGNLSSSSQPKENAAVFLRDMIRLTTSKSLVYELMPDLYVRFMGGVVKTDSDGFRITPGSCDKPDAYTIIGLGDSVMFGWGVHDDETYLAQFAQMSTEDCFRIVNMAVPGYNTVMEVTALREKGMAIDPDLVVVHFVDNDLYLPNFIRKNDNHITLTRSYLLAALSRWQGTRIRTRPFDHLVRSSGDVPNEYKYMVGIDAYRRSMEELKELSREYNFEILLLTNYSAPDYVLDISSELTIPLLNLGAPMQRYLIDNPDAVMTVSDTDPHYSASAHGVAARELYNYKKLRQDSSMPGQPEDIR